MLRPLTHRFLIYPTDLHALNEACIQQPPAGSKSTLKLDFDLFQKTTSLTSNNSSGNIPSAETTVTITSSQATSFANLTNAAATTKTANKIGITLGVSIGLALIVSTVVAIIWFRLHAQRKRIQQEAEVRRRWEGGHEARQKHDCACVAAELTALQRIPEVGGEGLVEADGEEVGK